ncbi:MAG: archease [Candidatus Rokubacteria bacterium]|nr:archease [Candidatus Rokubacteria bacterium]
MTDTAAGYDYFEVAADVGVRAWGPSRAEAFAQTTLGVFALIVSPDDVEPRETREVRAQGDSAEHLLVNWINECLYVHEIEGFVVRQVEVSACGDTLVHGLLRGEEIDRTRHRPGTIVKAATFHQVAVETRGGRVETRLIVDV